MVTLSRNKAISWQSILSESLQDKVPRYLFVLISLIILWLSFAVVFGGGRDLMEPFEAFLVLGIRLNNARFVQEPQGSYHTKTFRS